MPSAPQKRAWAKGRSIDTLSTAASSRPAAFWLNARTLAAHTPVSTLGKMLRITVLPAKSPSETSSSVPPVSVNVGRRGADRRQLADRVDGVAAQRDLSHGPSLPSGPAAPEVAHVDQDHEDHRDADRPPLVALQEVEDVEELAPRTSWPATTSGPAARRCRSASRTASRAGGVRWTPVRTATMLLPAKNGISPISAVAKPRLNVSSDSLVTPR